MRSRSCASARHTPGPLGLFSSIGGDYTLADMGKRREKRKGGGGGGTLMGMRAGMKRMVGQAPAKKKNPVWNVVSWILVIALAGAAIFLFARRYL